MRRLPAIALVSAIALAACAEAQELLPIPPAPARVATLADLVGPWQPTPFVLDPVWRNAIETACQRDVKAPRAKTAVIDARGGGIVTIRLTGRAFGKCDALRVTPEGRVEGAGGGMGGSNPELVPVGRERIGPIEEAFVFGGGLTITGWSVTALVPLAVTRVEVETDTSPPITASLEDGWFSAWWPAPPGDRGPEQSRMAEYRIRAFDAAGALVDEVP